MPAAKDRTPPATSVAQSTEPRDRSFPIDDYEELTVTQVLLRLDALDRCQLLQLREFERRHANRRSVLDALERALA